ncbi:acyltransferase [Purpureocillium lavendulum]|uniref:Acyltransferase n=1 Tax=Purpureocillium lavendulum TaxID=1247861 RepID=A0AB34FYU6_9HYPO|nr:acyltransferase [Purpureocillium lavendulum]
MPSVSSGLLGGDNWEEAKAAVASSDSDSEAAYPARWQAASWKSEPARIVTRLRSWLRPWSHGAQNPGPTAYLDGLRGFAALLVYWHHHELWVRNPYIFENAFGYDGNFYFATLPFVRTFFTGGHYSVTVFFVLSGYVLSIKPLSLIEKGDFAGLTDHLGSAIFRRFFRLYLPLIAVVLIYATTWQLFGYWVDTGTVPQGSWLSEMWAFYLEFKNFSFIFKEGGEPWMTYHRHIWSIPVEMRGSMIVFASVLALSRCTRKARLWCLVGLIFYFMYIADGYYGSMFLAGTLLCYLDMLAKTDHLPAIFERLSKYKMFIFYHMLAISVYLGGCPSFNNDMDMFAKSRGWYLLSLLKPQAVFNYKWFYLFWAGTLLVAAVPRINWLRSFFETRPCQYLGRISYALYLVHGPVLWTVGNRMYMAVGWHTEKQLEHIPQWANWWKLPQVGPQGLEPAFLLPQLVLMPLTLCLADFVTRSIDKPSVRFAAWLYRSTLPEAPGKHNRA